MTQLSVTPVDLGANTVGASHHGDPVTSRTAAERNSLRSGTQRTKVMHAIASHPAGLTAEEVTRTLGMREATSGSSAAKRLSELRACGYVIATGMTRPTVNGAQANVWIATPDGIRALDTALAKAAA